ncbi:MAG: tRNA1(Val) (adenine(37)-N6)-methyltransferase [Treponema sp.]|nr:tRNA1(Val) (adenine(37)-N6)-methyltransferase [Treponema sp.]
MRRIDTLKSGYKIIQDDKAFCFGIDAQLLAAFADLKRAKTVVDLGCGNGILPLLLYPEAQNCFFTGIEIQSEAAEMAEETVSLNNLDEKIKIINGDLKQIKKLMLPQKVDVVVTNPPYMTVKAVKENVTDAKSIARHEVLCSLEDLIAAAKYLLKPNGRFYMIHRPYRLQEIFSALEKNNLTPRRMQLVYPSLSARAEMVLIEAHPNYKPDLKMEKPLIMYDSTGIYTKDFEEFVFS